MILTDREIQMAIENKQVVVDPRPELDAFASSSLDLTLARKIAIWKTDNEVKGVEPRIICPAVGGYKYSELAAALTKEVDIGASDFILEPGAFALGWTEEKVHLPNSSRLAARVEGKSSLARLGLGVHVTAPTIHAGFEGTIQLELCNHSGLRIKLTPGMRVCQLIFEQTLGTPAKGYSGQFLGQKNQ